MDGGTYTAFCRLGKDPESKFTPNGTMVTEVTAAVEMGTGEYKRTEWIKLTGWGEKFGELFTGMTQKGTYLWVSGAPKVDAWVKDGEAKSQLNVTVKSWKILGGGKPKGEEESTPYDE